MTTETKGRISVTSLTNVPASMTLVAYLSGGSASASAPIQSVRIVNESAGTSSTGGTASMSLQEREESWLLFLASRTVPDGAFTIEQVGGARRIWRIATSLLTKDLPLPSTRESADGTLLIVWDTPTVLVELEVFSNGSFAWFARNRQTGKYAGSGDEPIMHFPVELLQNLSDAFPSFGDAYSPRAA